MSVRLCMKNQLKINDEELREHNWTSIPTYSLQTEPYFVTLVLVDIHVLVYGL